MGAPSFPYISIGMNIDGQNIFLRAIRNEHKDSEDDGYPFNLPVVRELSTLEFQKSVTYIVGDNGTGKSTLLESIAVLLGLNPEGGSKNFRFSTMPTHSRLTFPHAGPPCREPL